MKNFVQAGKEITVRAPYDLSSGEVVIVDALRGVAITDAKEGDEVTISTQGVYDIPKQKIAVLQGNVAYFDLRTRLATKAPAVQEEEEGNEMQQTEGSDLVLLGVFTENSGESSGVGRVKIG